MKRIITPHKGNRDVQINFRCTVATANQIQLILAQRTAQTGKRFTLADWVAEKAAQDNIRIKKGKTMNSIDITEISSETIYNIAGREFEPSESTPEEVYNSAIKSGQRFVEYENGKYLFAKKADAIYYIRANWPQ